MIIAICDDEIDFHEIMGTEMEKAFAKNDCEVDLFMFHNAWDLMKATETKVFDAVFLDINMPELDGFELAEIIIKNSEHTQVVFVTSFDIFMHKAFDFRPFGYVRKNNLNHELNDTVKRLIQYVEKINIYVDLGNKKEYARWRLSDIYYFESRNNNIIVYGKMGNFNYRGKMSEQERQLNKYGFVIINRGLLVNLRYVVKMGKSHMTLSNDVELPISKGRYDEVKKGYLMYKNILF